MPRILVILFVLLFANAIASPAAALAADGGNGGPMRLGARVTGLAHTAAARSFQRRLSSLAEADETTELSGLVQAHGGSSLTALDKATLSIPQILGKPGVRHLLSAIKSGKRPSAAQLRRLAGVLAALTHNAAVRKLTRQGRVLKAHPEKLRSAVARLVTGIQSQVLVEPPAKAEGDPFAAIGNSLRGRTSVPGASSLAQAAAKILATPGATRYLMSLSPFSLGSLMSTTAALEPRARGSSAGGAPTGTSCSDAELQVLTDALNGVSESMAETTFEEGGKDTLVKAIKRYLPDYFKAARALAGNPLTTILRTLGWNAAKAAYPAVRRAALNCFANRIALVPPQQTITAGHWQMYKIAIYGESGEQLFGDWINDPDEMKIWPGDDPTDGARCNRTLYWECYGDKKGPHDVRATLGGMTVEGVLTVEPGPPVAIKVVPESATVGAGEASPSYQATGEDAYHNVTESIVPGRFTKDGVRAHLSMFPPDGPCSDATAKCTPGAPGPHNVIIERDDGVRNHALLEVLLNKLSLSPASATVTLGESQAYSPEEISAIGMKDLGPVGFGSGPGQATLSISPDGTCDQATATCTPAEAGPHTIAASSATASGEASLLVKEGAEEEGNEGTPIAAIRWTGTITLTSQGSGQSLDGSWEWSERGVLQIDENILDGGIGADITGSRHPLSASYSITGSESSVGSCHSSSGVFDQQGRAGYPVPVGESGFYLYLKLYPDDFAVNLFPIWVQDSIVESFCPPTPPSSFTINRRFDPDCGEEPLGVPLTRTGDHVTATARCARSEPEISEETTIELDLTATCFSGDLPDADWECPGTRPG